MLSAFVARYTSGKCGACAELIEKGDAVVFVDDVLVHLDCESEALMAVAITRPADVCRRCFLVRPCPCDDERSAS